MWHGGETFTDADLADFLALIFSFDHCSRLVTRCHARIDIATLADSGMFIEGAPDLRK